MDLEPSVLLYWAWFYLAGWRQFWTQATCAWKGLPDAPPHAHAYSLLLFFFFWQSDWWGCTSQSCPWAPATEPSSRYSPPLVLLILEVLISGALKWRDLSPPSPSYPLRHGLHSVAPPTRSLRICHCAEPHYPRTWLMLANEFQAVNYAWHLHWPYPL